MVKDLEIIICKALGITKASIKQRRLVIETVDKIEEVYAPIIKSLEEANKQNSDLIFESVKKETELIKLRHELTLTMQDIKNSSD